MTFFLYVLIGVGVGVAVALLLEAIVAPAVALEPYLHHEAVSG
jgi:hypothetical protein